MSDNKKSNRKILTVILLLIFVGAGILYFTINLEDSGFVEPMNEEELELLDDDVEDDSSENDSDADTSNNTTDTGRDMTDSTNNQSTSSDQENRSDSDSESSETEDQDTSNNNQQQNQAESGSDSENQTTYDTNDLAENSDDSADNPDGISDDSDNLVTDSDDISDKPDETADDSNEPAENLSDPEESSSNSEEQEPTTSEQLTKESLKNEDTDETSGINGDNDAADEEGIIDRIISFLSDPFNSDDSEDRADNGADEIAGNGDDTNGINGNNNTAESNTPEDENLDQIDSDAQLKSNNLVVLGIDDLAGEEESTFDFIGLISFNAEDLEIEFNIIPSRLTYNGQELREFPRDELKTIITELTDYQIDYEVILDYTGFQYYVNQINGIELELANNFIVPDLDLELTQGINHLNGTETLNYARFYAPDNGERSRINRQQEVVDKVYQKSLKLENLLRLPEHYNYLVNEEEAVRTNIDQTMIRNIIRYIRQLNQISIDYNIFQD